MLSNKTLPYKSLCNIHHADKYYVNLQRIQTLTAPGYKGLLLKMHFFTLFPRESCCLNFRMSF